MSTLTPLEFTRSLMPVYPWQIPSIHDFATAFWSCHLLTSTQNASPNHSDSEERGSQEKREKENRNGTGEFECAVGGGSYNALFVAPIEC